MCLVVDPYRDIFEFVCSVNSPVVDAAPGIQWPPYKS